MSDESPLERLDALSRQQRSQVEVPEDLTARVKDLHSLPSSNRRKVHMFIGIGVISLAAASGAAAMLLARQPDRPEAGVVCRATAATDADAYVVALSADPVEACAELWRAGAITGQPSPEAPALSACVGENGAVEVFPGEGSCAHLGLTPAATELDARTAAVVELQSYVADRINLGPCRDVDSVEQLVNSKLRDLALEDWTIETQSGLSRTDCVKAVVDGVERTVTLAAP